LKASCLTNFPPLREELKRHNDESINSAVTKIRLENSARHSFKSKGNEEQYNHQEKVATHFDSAIESLHSGKLVEVRNVLGEGKNLDTSGGAAIIQETLPLQAATHATLGNASWYSYHRSQQLC
ncbi:unnamed protein product, partial [Porites lobata]